MLLHWSWWLPFLFVSKWSGGFLYHLKDATFVLSVSLKLCFFFISWRCNLYFMCAPLKALVIELVILRMWGFNWWKSICPFNQSFEITVPEFVLVFTKLFLLLNPYSTVAWPWLKINNNSKTNDTSSYFMILIMSKKTYLISHFVSNHSTLLGTFSPNHW